MNVVRKIIGAKHYLPIVLEGIRKADGIVAQESGKTLQESQEPSGGPFYVVRYPDQWKIIPFFEKEMGWMDHTDAWEDYVAPILADKWKGITKNPRLEQDLKLLVYSFPRGRVSREGESRGKYLISTGGDLWDSKGTGKAPARISLASIERLFGIAGMSKVEFDEHEQVQTMDKDAVRRLLKIKEDWKSV